MIRLTLSSIRLRLLLLILLSMVPASVLMIYSAAEQRQLAAAAVQENALRLIKPASAQYERQVEGTRQFLAVLARLPGVRARDAEACSELFADLLINYPIYTNLGAADTAGNVFCSAVRQTGAVNLKDRAYFQRAVRNRDFSIGDYQIGRITGKMAVNFGHPVLDELGQVRAVVFAALNLSWLQEMAKEANLPHGSTLTLIDRQGTVLVRYPQSRGWVGRPLSDKPLLRTILSQETGVAHSQGSDGTPRLYAFAPLGEGVGRTGAYLSIGIPRDMAFAQADSQLQRNLATLILVGLLTLLLAWLGGNWFFLRQVQTLVHATRRLSRGDLTVRSGLCDRNDELGQLACSFDEMAQSLQQAHRHIVESEAEKKRFYREIIRCVTHGKFHLVDPEEIVAEGELVLDLPLDTPDDYPALRKRLREVAVEAGLSREGVGDIVLAAGEAATNAIKHATDGRSFVYLAQDRIIVQVRDRGRGIQTDNLPATILMPGFSTKISMGMGYTLMLQLVDKVWLSTGPDGTFIQIEKWLRPEEHEENPMETVMERFKS